MRAVSRGWANGARASVMLTENSAMQNLLAGGGSGAPQTR
jgi:hypothetical protein